VLRCFSTRLGKEKQKVKIIAPQGCAACSVKINIPFSLPHTGFFLLQELDASPLTSYKTGKINQSGDKNQNDKIDTKIANQEEYK